MLCSDSSQIRALIERGCSPGPEQSPKPSGSGGSRLLIYDMDTERKQLGKIRGGGNIPATFLRTNGIWNPDLCLEGRAKLLIIEVIIMEQVPAGLKEL